MNTTNKNPGFIEVTRAVPTDFNWARASFHEGVLGKKINSDFYKQSSMPKSLNFILNMVTLPSEKADPFIAFRRSAGTPAATDSLQAWKERLAFKSAAFYCSQILLMGSTAHPVSP